MSFEGRHNIILDCLRFAYYKCKLTLVGINVLKKWFFSPEMRSLTTYILKFILYPLTAVATLLFLYLGTQGYEDLKQNISKIEINLIENFQSAPLIWSLIAVTALLIFSFVYFGRLKFILRYASKSDNGFKYVEGILAKGRKKPENFRRLCEIYKPIIERINEELNLKAGFQFHEKNFAATFLPIKNPTLDTLLNPNLHKTFAEREISDFAVNADERQDYYKKKRCNMSEDAFKDIEAGPNYCLTKIDIKEGSIQLDIGIAEYGKILRTSDCLITELELFSGIEGKTVMSSDFMLRCLPWRKKIHNSEKSQIENLFLRPNTRAAGLGISALTVVKNEDETYDFLVGRRGSFVATYPGVLQTVPSGMCNVKRVEISKYLEFAIKSEFFEEAFNDKDLEKYKGSEWLGILRDRINDKHSPFTDKYKGELILTGLAFDLQNLRPEVCSIILIKDKRFRANVIDKNNNDIVDQTERSLNVKPNWEFDTEILLESILDFDMPINDVSQAAAANYILGKQKLQQIL